MANYNKYQKLMLMERVKGTTSWYPSVSPEGELTFKKGEIIEIDSPDCGAPAEPIYRWYVIPNSYMCDEELHIKYQERAYQVSTDGGLTWKDVQGVEHTKGDIIERDSKDCGFIELQYRWENLDPSIDFYCDGVDQYYSQIYQVSHDNGETWENVFPPMTKRGSLFETQAVACGYDGDWIETDDFLCTYRYKGKNYSEPTIVGRETSHETPKENDTVCPATIIWDIAYPNEEKRQKIKNSFSVESMHYRFVVNNLVWTDTDRGLRLDFDVATASGKPDEAEVSIKIVSYENETQITTSYINIYFFQTATITSITGSTKALSCSNRGQYVQTSITVKGTGLTDAWVKNRVTKSTEYSDPSVPNTLLTNLTSSVSGGGTSIVYTFQVYVASCVYGSREWLRQTFSFEGMSGTAEFTFYEPW